MKQVLLKMTQAEYNFVRDQSIIAHRTVPKQMLYMLFGDVSLTNALPSAAPVVDVAADLDEDGIDFED